MWLMITGDGSMEVRSTRKHLRYNSTSIRTNTGTSQAGGRHAANRYTTEAVRLPRRTRYVHIYIVDGMRA